MIPNFPFANLLAYANSGTKYVSGLVIWWSVH